MKTKIISTIKTHAIKAVMLVGLLSCFSSIDSTAQGDRTRPQSNRYAGQGAARNNQGRQLTVNQEQRGNNRFFSRERVSDNPRLNPGRGAIGNNANRPTNYNFTRRGDDNSRPGTVAYNRPGERNNRSYYGNYKRRGNDFNNGYRGYHGHNGYNYYKRPAYNPRNPNWCYVYAPRRNSIFYSLPSSYFSISFGGFGYRYYDGIFYRPYDNIFRVVAPPIGIHVNILPFGYSRIFVNDYPHYYYNGVYYDYRNKNYTVVSPPVGAIVESLPDGYKTITIGGETYYEVDGAQYKPLVQENGEIGYEVIKAS